MLNLSPTNGEGNGNGDSPDIILESPSEDDDIDISQFVESVLEEPDEPPPPRSPPPMVYFPNQSARKSHQVFRGGIQVPLLSQSSVPVFALASGIRPVQTVTLPVQLAVPPLHHVYPTKTLLVSNEGHGSMGNNELPSIAWLKDCFEKVKTSSATFTNQVKCLEDRLRCITSTSDTKKITSFSNDLQSLLKQSELGYKYLGTKLSADHQAWALKASQRRLTLNMAFNGNQDVLVRRPVLLPLSGDNNTITLRPNERLTLPPNMIISVNGNNHSVSITPAGKAMDERRKAELCAQYGIKPCYVMLERCDTPEDGDTDNDDIEIIEELIAL